MRHRTPIRKVLLAAWCLASASGWTCRPSSFRVQWSQNNCAMHCARSMNRPRVEWKNAIGRLWVWCSVQSLPSSPSRPFPPTLFPPVHSLPSILFRLPEIAHEGAAAGGEGCCGCMMGGTGLVRRASFIRWAGVGLWSRQNGTGVHHMAHAIFNGM